MHVKHARTHARAPLVLSCVTQPLIVCATSFWCNGWCAINGEWEKRTLTLCNGNLIDTGKTELRAKSKWQPINDRFHASAGWSLRLRVCKTHTCVRKTRSNKNVMYMTRWPLSEYILLLMTYVIRLECPAINSR